MKRGMESLQQFTAVEARKLVDDAQSTNGVYMREETNMILNEIKAAAEKGKSTITVYFTDTIVINRLTNLGYIVKVINDQRDGDFTVITW